MQMPTVTVRIKGDLYKEVLEYARKLEIPLSDAVPAYIVTECERARQDALKEAEAERKRLEARLAKVEALIAEREKKIAAYEKERAELADAFGVKQTPAKGKKARSK